jgi:hypothetical protein
MGVGRSMPCFSCFISGKETHYPLGRRLGGPRAGLDVCGKPHPHQGSNHDLLYCEAALK